MSSGTHAWRFAMEPVSDPDRPGGPVVDARGMVELLDEAASVRQAILLLVATRPGERVMRPEYGCHLYRLAFAPNDDTTAGLAIHYVRASLERWEPRIVVLAVDANANPEQPGRLDIDLLYRLRSRAAPERLRVGLDLDTARLV